MSSTPCFAFRIETMSVVGRVKIEFASPGLDLSSLPEYLVQAVTLWAASAGAAAVSAPDPRTTLSAPVGALMPVSGAGAGSPPPAAPKVPAPAPPPPETRQCESVALPKGGAVFPDRPAGAPWPQPTFQLDLAAAAKAGPRRLFGATGDAASPSAAMAAELGAAAPSAAPLAPRTLAAARFHRTGRVPEERLARAARLGGAWSAWLQHGGPKPPAEVTSGVIAVYWAVLRGGPWDAWGDRPSIHDRKESPGPAFNGGYWSRVAECTASAWRTAGEVHERSAYEGFGSLEELFRFLEAAGCEPGDVLDFRFGRGGRH